MIDLIYRLALGLVFSSIFAFQDAQNREVSNLVINLAIVVGILMSLVDWLFFGAPLVAVLVNIFASFAIMVLGIFLNAKGIMGAGDGFYFGVLALFFPVFLFSAFNMPLVYWMAASSFLLAVTGTIGDRILHGQGEKKFAFGPFLLGGFLSGIILFLISG